MNKKSNQRNDLVLRTLIRFADNDMTVNKSIREIAKAIGISFHPVRMALRELEAMGKLEVLFRGSQGTGPSKYKIHVIDEDIASAKMELLDVDFDSTGHGTIEECRKPKIDHWDKLRRYIIKLEAANKEKDIKIKELQDELRYYKKQEELVKKIVSNIDDEFSVTVEQPRRVVIDGNGHCLGLK